jgi:spermidine synthase
MSEAADSVRATDALTSPAPRRFPSRRLLAVYAVTGFTGLLAEQGFERYIALLVGATASASAVVLFTYFLGFALGGFAAARLLNGGRIRRALMAYGLVEGLAGISCVLFSYGFHAATARLAPLEGMVHGAAMQFQLRFLFGCVLVLPTAALLGASFPLIAAALDSSDPTARKRWARAYSVNLAGALLAALAAPFVILPMLGLRGAMWVCCGANACVAAAAAVLSWRLPPTSGAAAPSPAKRVRAVRLLLAGAFASGVVIFALEVIWTHLVGVVIGSTAYAFSWMLAAILAGLLLGARSAQAERGMRTSVLFQCSALLLLAQLYLWDKAPRLFNATLPPALCESFYVAEILKLAVAGALLVPCSIALGLIYPRILASGELVGEKNAHIAGYLSAANSLGCLTGALVGIFVLLPRAGSELSLKIGVAVLVLFALLFLRQEAAEAGRWARMCAMAVVIVLMLGRWHWDLATLTAGTGNYFGRRADPPSAGPAVQVSPLRIVFSDESVQGGITTVVEETVTSGGRSETIRTLLTNGKFQGDDRVTTSGQTMAQFGFAAIPSLFVEGWDRALLIGLGTGHSAATLRHAGYREIDVAEFSPGIVGAAKECFRGLNGNVLASPEVHLLLEDGRNVLLADSRTRYNLITIEISSVWIAGSTNLYSKQFYELARARLRPGGVLQQWVQFHHMSPKELSSELATLRSVFPYVGLWFYGYQGMMVAADRPLVVSDARRTELAQRFNDAAVVPELEGARVLSPEGVDRLIAANRPVINTDHNRWMEYASPRYAATSYDWVAHNRVFLAQYR